MKRIVVGTTNPAKSAALRQLLEPVAEAVTPPISGHPAVEEDGRSIAEIAERKALAWSQWLKAHGVHLPVIVTDGGLTIPALGEHWNPTRTRRFSGEDKTPLELAQALIGQTTELYGEERRIGWIEVAAIARSDGRSAVFHVEGPPGILATSVRPEDLIEPDGFWVPAVWLCPEFEMKRLIDLTEEERSRRSDHWELLGAALRKDLVAFLSD